MCKSYLYFQDGERKTLNPSYFFEAFGLTKPIKGISLKLSISIGYNVGFEGKNVPPSQYIRVTRALRPNPSGTIHGFLGYEMQKKS